MRKRNDIKCLLKADKVEKEEKKNPKINGTRTIIEHSYKCSSY